MDAVMYGMIPSAKIEAWENAPPENMSSNCMRPLLLVKFERASRSSGEMPGRTT